ncbi:MAG: hypothetical protein JWQ16_1480 [Novosphingobium sp.]|nr:hypothetical protein [Novosphingobium sp.]
MSIAATDSRKFDHFRGDATGLMIPAHDEAFRADGAAFLTEAFRAFGSLSSDNSVARITRLEPCPGGSTGAKLFVSVEYANSDPALDTELFVKFSRDFGDPRRDWQRTEMKSEAPFMALSRLPGFPIRVPAAYFADYHDATGTGLVITEQVPYGRAGIEPHRRKCLDHLTMPDALPYYRAVVTALARLAGAHKSGRLAPDVDARFPLDPVQASADPIRYAPDELDAELAHGADFARRCPRLVPEELRSDDFIARMARDAWAIRDHEAAIQRFLLGNPDMIALCHWNAHIDNCFFWRDAARELQCGLIDWGRVGQITLGSALWGALSAAHHDIWDLHLHELLALFASEYAAQGGPRLTVAALEQHLTLHIAAMGVARVLAFPEIISFRLPECADATGPYDPMFEPVAVDAARNCRQVYVNMLKYWQSRDFGKAVDGIIGGLS